MVNERVQKSSSWGPQPQAKSSPFASPPIPARANVATPQDIENQAFMENKHEALGLQLQAKYGTITPQGQERLTLLQAKRDAFWRDRLKSIPDYSLVDALVGYVSSTRNAPAKPKKEAIAPTKTRSTPLRTHRHQSRTYSPVDCLQKEDGCR